MFTNYLQIAFRTLAKNRVFSLITVSGLSVGMAAFLFIVHYVRFEKSYEDFHLNSPNICRVTLDLYNGAEYVVTDCETHQAMGPLLKERMPEVRDFVRMFHYDGLQDIKVRNEKFLEEGLYYADESIFNIFSLNVLKGNKTTALTDPYTAVVSESVAQKYYGKTDAVGELLDINGQIYHVTGVMQDVPLNTHIKFKILLSHSTLPQKNPWYKEDQWNGNNEYLYLLMNPTTDLVAFNEKLQKLSLEFKEKLNGSRYSAQPMRDIHLYSNKTFEPEANGNARTVYFLIVIAAFIIVIAWVNYVNLSTARAVERAREVGIRKVMGSMKSQLIFQFLAESGVISLLSGILALALFFVLLPVFRNLTGQPLPMNFFRDPVFWSLFSTLLLAGSLFSGIYPAFVLSSFQPASVLKGKFQSSAHGQSLRKALVVLQFGATILLIICMCTVYLQVNYLRHYDLGLNVDQTLVVRGPRLNASDSAFENLYHNFRNDLLSDPSVQIVTHSGSLPGLSLHELSSTTTSRLGKEKENNGGYEFYYFGIDEDFITGMDMKLVAGRNFEAGKSNQDQVIVNEEAVRRLGFANAEAAIGEKITFQTRWPGEPARITGVLRNFYQRSPKEPHIPMILKNNDTGDYFSIRLHTKDTHAALASVKSAWSRIYPDNVFSYFFLNEKFGQQFQADAQFGKVMALFSALAVFIACLGLFGLSSYTISQRTKEIGIRKVLGASVGQIVTLLSQDFAKVVAIAAVIALPAAWFAMDSWLSNYAVRVGLNPWLFIFPVILILVIALITVSFQTIKTAIANPVNALKQE